jgi:hypothetical protein
MPEEKIPMKNLRKLYEMYQALLIENETLKKENELMKARLGIAEPVQAKSHVDPNPLEKIRLFMSLFKGRDDVYARRWENREGRSGYTPVCLNEWKSGTCRKPSVKCSECLNRSYDTLSENVIEGHLRGNVVVGVYPLRPDETCNFLAIDFDDEGWQKDVFTLRDVCKDFDIPEVVERSRSGNGAHARCSHQNPI